MSATAGARVWAWRVLAAFVGLVLLVQAWFFACVVYWRFHNPETTAFMRHESDRLERAAPGAHGMRRLQRVWVDYGHLSAQLKRAVITAEDARFLAHDGVDWDAMERAYEDNRARRARPRGGSTITQQLAKNLFLSAQRSYLRKAQELLIAFMIEALWDKRRILEVYLNVVEWGDGVFGAEAGARHYFGIPAAGLDAQQAARMAAMLPAPKFFDHHRDSPYLEERAEGILRYLDQARIP